jgi:two-component system KDP operon response regulator KdpE
MKQALLIADDDAELCDICRKFFTKFGYEVETAADGLDCLEKLRRRPPAVLVLDLGLRWGGGDGVLARLREESALPSFPVVLTATAGYLPDGPALIEPPVVHCLHKPFALNALLESVRSAVASGGRGEPSRSHRVAAYPELFIG